jgi:hypothetical protein
MKEDTRERLIRGDIWIRLLYMILFAFAFGIARFIIVVVVVFQFFTILITGCANEPLLRFGNSLSIYVSEILDFQTFNTELQPFPFSPWPDEQPGGGRWLDGDEDGTASPEAEEDSEGSEEDSKG